MPELSDRLIGKKVGQYEVISLLGQGGMATVYRARQNSMSRDVALKVVSNILAQDTNFEKRFNREVELIARLEHAHIVPVHEHGITPDGMIYLSMRYLKGGTLSELITRESPMPLERISRILDQIASALDYAHGQGFLHRDIKPSNILLDDLGNAYLTDFGLARMIAPDDQNVLTAPDTLLGTPKYLSPEQVNQGKLDARSDIYSLGVVLYEMIGGRPPFNDDSTFQILRGHLDQTPPSIRKLRPDLSIAVEIVMDRALEKDPEKRYQHAGDLAQDFARAVRGEAPTHRISSVRRRRDITITLPTGWRPQSRSRLLMVGVVMVVLLAGLAFLITRTLNNAPPLIDESQRPATGTPDTLVPTKDEIDRARQRLQGSFIGIIACSLESDWHTSLVRAARTRADTFDLPVKLEDSKADKVRQPGIINTFVAQGAKAIIICPIDNDAIGTAIKAAQDAGVVIIITGPVVYGKLSATMTVTEEAQGQAVGQYTADMINREMNGTANVAILDYPPVPYVQVRAKAMEDTLRAKAPNAIILGRWQGGLTEDGEKYMTEALKEHPEINVIMSINDAGALGAVKALQAANKKPDEVAIVSVDADAVVRQMIKAGQYFRASFDNDPGGTGMSMMDAAVKILAGATIPRQILLPGRMITRENVDSVGQPATATP